MDILDQKPAQVVISLRTKLVVSTGGILIVAALLLGGLFIRQQTRSASESLVQSGAFLAQHLASMGRFSIVAGDTHRLDQLIQEILEVDLVAYAAVLSSGGELQAGGGKAMWQQQFLKPTDGQRQFSVAKLTQSRYVGVQSIEPFVTGIWLAEDGPLLREYTDFSLMELLSLMGGVELPIFYDMVVRVSQHVPAPVGDPALQLTLDDGPDRREVASDRGTTASTFVDVGLSTSYLQHTLRRVLWQATIMTISIMVASLVIALLLARRMTTPLRELTRAATKLAAGDVVTGLDVRTTDEIGMLTRVFNVMTATLQSREHELRELTQTLEHRVEVRTEELAAANAKLKELDRRKSVFVSTASHELRTPLTSMKVHLANLRDGIDGAVTDDQRQSLLRVDANLSRLQTLIDELLDLSQIEMGQTSLQLEQGALGSVIAKAIEDLHPFSSERGVRIMMALPGDLPMVVFDPDKLRQILLNLLHNAVKFTPIDTIVNLTVLRTSDEIQVSVRDVGPGIAPEDVEKVFQPFYRARTSLKEFKGTGLGLAIAKQLVELHHGRLWVETELGGGSCFSFALPIVPSEASLVADVHGAGHSQSQTG